MIGPAVWLAICCRSAVDRPDHGPVRFRNRSGRNWPGARRKAAWVGSLRWKTAILFQNRKKKILNLKEILGFSIKR